MDWSGRAIREDKRGAIPGCLPPILSRLGIKRQTYVGMLRRNEYPLHRALGRLAAMREAAKTLGQSFLKGTHIAASLLG